MFGNNNFKPKDDSKKPDKKDKDGDGTDAPDFSEEDKEELEQDEPDTVTLHPETKDLVEKLMKIRRNSLNESERIFGHSWDDIKKAQSKTGSLHQKVKIEPGKDYGSDPLGNGKHRMVPSGRIVDDAERKKILGR